MKFRDLSSMLGQEIKALHEADNPSKDELNRIDGIAKLSKQFIQVAHVEMLIEKMMCEHKDIRFSVGRLLEVPDAQLHGRDDQVVEGTTVVH